MSFDDNCSDDDDVGGRENSGFQSLPKCSLPGKWSWHQTGLDCVATPRCIVAFNCTSATILFYCTSHYPTYFLTARICFLLDTEAVNTKSNRFKHCSRKMTSDRTAATPGCNAAQKLHKIAQKNAQKLQKNSQNHIKIARKCTRHNPPLLWTMYCYCCSINLKLMTFFGQSLKKQTTLN